MFCVLKFTIDTKVLGLYIHSDSARANSHPLSFIHEKCPVQCVIFMLYLVFTESCLYLDLLYKVLLIAL